MLRIAVISDLHLGFGHGTELSEDAFGAAQQVFELALKQDPHLILVPGDIFHDRIPKPEILGWAIELFTTVNKSLKPINLVSRIKDGQLTEQKAPIPPIVAIWGTHERRHTQSVNPVQILEKAGLLTCLHAESILIETEIGKLGIHGLSGVPENYARDALRAWSPQPFPNVPNILLIHQSFSDMIPISGNVLGFADLPKGFDIFLLGHIHWSSEAKHPAFQTPIIIPGSTIRTQLTKVESEKPKGFYIIELSGQAGSTKFIPISSRPFFYEKLNVDGKKPNEILELASQSISKYLEQEYAQKPIIRLKLEGKLAQGFYPSDVSLGSIKSTFEQKAILSLDKSNLQAAELAERTRLLTDLKGRRLSMDQMGLELLNESLNTKLDPKKLEIIFNLLAEGALEQAEKELE